MDAELKRLLRQMMESGALVNGVPTSSTFSNTTDSLEAIKDTIGTPAGASIAADLVVIDDFVDNFYGFIHIQAKS